MHRIHDEFRFDPGATSITTPVTRVLAERSGVCQDFAHLQIACLRSLGLAARYVSGYLLTDPPPGQPRLVGADASHAWLSVWCPRHGWVDLDPTNAVLPDSAPCDDGVGPRLRRRQSRCAASSSAAPPTSCTSASASFRLHLTAPRGLRSRKVVSTRGSVSFVRTAVAAPWRRAALWSAALAALFVFRLLFGLSREFFFEDETQIFLMGLRYHATGAWPYFGADVVWTKSVIPGALQALLVGVPLNIVPAPEAPFVLLNLLSMAALAAFAWYITARLPQLPRWLVWGWLMTLPWTLQFSTHVINPSYLLAPALLFFIGFFEAVPAFRLGRIPEPVAFALMGAAITWVMQIHMSWPLLLPYAALAWLSMWRRGARVIAANTAGLVGGLLLFGVLLIPTVVTYGLEGGSGGTLRNLRPHFVNPWIAITTLARLLAFASHEIWRFIAADDGKRFMFMLEHLWLAPIVVVVWLAGLWQPIWMLREWFRSRSPFAEWRPLKWLLAGTVGLVYASYWFVLEPPQAHAFYVVAPVAFMFAAYCWTFVDSPRWRQMAAGLLAANIVLHASLAWIEAPEMSLYRNREVVTAAIERKQPELFAHRRAFAIDGGPPVLNDPSRPYDGRNDVKLSNVTQTMGPRRVAFWTFTLRNTNPRVAYRDVLHQTTYRDASGRIVDQRYDYIKDIYQPGAVAELKLNDGFVPTPFASATIEVLGAEALLPLR